MLFPIYPFLFMDSGIVAEQGPDWMTKVSAGTGPFKFKQWRRGVSVDLAANADYWGGAPKIDGVSFLIVPDADTALSQYDAGELDFVDVYASAIRRVLRDATLREPTDPGAARAVELSRHEREPLRTVQGQARARGDLARDRPRGDDPRAVRRRRVPAERRGDARRRGLRSGSAAAAHTIRRAPSS